MLLYNVNGLTRQVSSTAAVTDDDTQMENDGRHQVIISNRIYRIFTTRRMPASERETHALTRGFSVRASAEFLLLHADCRPVFDVCIYEAELAEGVFVRRLQSHRQPNVPSVLPKPGAA